MAKVSVVIVTLNEEKNIARALKSVKWADEILVCDMHSDDKTVEIARSYGAKISYHPRVNFVEPARNPSIERAKNEWVLILDADEEIPATLIERIKLLVSKPIESNFVNIPRKNLIFDKWMKASMWWPDYQVRLFRKGKVSWQGKIHSQPKTEGQGLRLPAEEQLAIIHHNYDNVFQFIERMNRYTTIEAEQLQKEGYKFNWQDLLQKPLSEFLSRYFANSGFTDGLHGLALSLLQSLSFLIVYLKVWEREKFYQREISLEELEQKRVQLSQSLDYWFKYSKRSKNLLKSFFQRMIK